MQRESDSELVQRFRAEGSQQAFAALVERHTGMVRSTCRRMLGGAHALVDDACQAVFLILARKADGIREPALIGAWLHETARQVSANIRRGEERRKRRELEAASVGPSEGTRMATHDVSPGAVDGRLDPLLDAALATLSPLQRDTVVRHFLEGKAQAEVAAELGVSEGAIKKRVADAMANLRSFFARRGIAASAMALALALSAEASGAVVAQLLAACQAAPSGGSAAAEALQRQAAGTGARLPVIAAAVVAAAMAAALIVAALRLSPTPAGQAASAPSRATASAGDSLEADMRAPLRALRANDLRALLDCLPGGTENGRTQWDLMAGKISPLDGAIDRAIASADGSTDGPSAALPMPADLMRGLSGLTAASPLLDDPDAVGVIRGVSDDLEAWATATRLFERDPHEALALRLACVRALGAHSAADFRRLGFDLALARGGALLAAIKSGYAAYGLDFDRLLDSVAIERVDGLGDERVAMIRFSAFDHERTLPLKVYRVDGRWQCPLLQRLVLIAAMGVAVSVVPGDSG